MSCYYVGYVLGHHHRTAAAAADRAHPGIRHSRGRGLGRHSGPRLLRQSLGLGASCGCCPGLCLAGIYVVAESWAQRPRQPREPRPAVRRVHAGAVYRALGAAKFLLVLSSPSTATPFMLVSALISLAMVPIVVSAQRTPDTAIPSKGTVCASCIAISPLGVVGVAVAGLISSHRVLHGPGLRASQRPGPRAVWPLSWR